MTVEIISGLARFERQYAPGCPEANQLGCICSANNCGEGIANEGVNEFTINPECKLRSDPQAHYRAYLRKGDVK